MPSRHIEILIAGKNPSEKILERARKYKFVRVLGFVKEIEEFWAAIDCMVVPHVSGSGLRIKMLESLASNIHVIANPEAARPLGEISCISGLLHVVDLGRFSDEILRLASEKSTLAASDL